MADDMEKKTANRATSRTKMGGIFLTALTLLGLGHAPQSSAADIYPNFATLAQHEVSGVDYQIRWQRTGSDVTIFAIHGGGIEPGTSELATAVAASDLNAYLFEGIKPTHNSRLHITSNNFDEPHALMLTSSNWCVSMHGFLELAKHRVCVGGGNAEFRATFVEAAKVFRLPYEVLECDVFKGTGRTNIVNRCKNQGLQLEFSTVLRAELMKSPRLLKPTVDAVRWTIAKMKTRSKLLPNRSRRDVSLEP